MVANFIRERVRIEFNDNEVWHGKVIDYTIAGDNDPEEESIILVPSDGPKKGRKIEIFEHEVKNIKKI